MVCNVGEGKRSRQSPMYKFRNGVESSRKQSAAWYRITSKAGSHTAKRKAKQTREVS